MQILPGRAAAAVTPPDALRIEKHRLAPGVLEETNPTHASILNNCLTRIAWLYGSISSSRTRVPLSVNPKLLDSPLLHLRHMAFIVPLGYLPNSASGFSVSHLLQSFILWRRPSWIHGMSYTYTAYFIVIL